MNDLAETMRPVATDLAHAVQGYDPSAVAHILTPLNKTELYALAVVLADEMPVRNRHSELTGGQWVNVGGIKHWITDHNNKIGA